MRDDERDDAPEGTPPEESAEGTPVGDPPEADITGAEPPVGGAAEGEASADGPAGGDDDPGDVETGTPGDEPAADDAPAEDATPVAEADAAPAADDAEPAGADDAPAPPPEPTDAPAARGGDEPEAIPGAHLEPDLVLEDQRPAGGDEFGQYATDGVDAVVAEDGEAAPPTDPADTEAPITRTALDLAADARYSATGKRKSAVARVILRPGTGTYVVNGRELDTFFPRPRLQKIARQPLETIGYEERMDVVARIHGGGVSAQATALRHGIARALVEADPNLRTDLKRRGYLTRDPRQKERKKAGLKKARKRPQFSKR